MMFFLFFPRLFHALKVIKKNTAVHTGGLHTTVIAKNKTFMSFTNLIYHVWLPPASPPLPTTYLKTRGKKKEEKSKQCLWQSSHTTLRKKIRIVFSFQNIRIKKNGLFSTSLHPPEEKKSQRQSTHARSFIIPFENKTAVTKEHGSLPDSNNRWCRNGNVTSCTTIQKATQLFANVTQNKYEPDQHESLNIHNINMF